MDELNVSDSVGGGGGDGAGGAGCVGGVSESKKARRLGSRSRRGSVSVSEEDGDGGFLEPQSQPMMLEENDMGRWVIRGVMIWI